MGCHKPTLFYFDKIKKLCYNKLYDKKEGSTMAKELRYYECCICGTTYLAEREAIECEIKCLKDRPSVGYRVADALITNQIVPCDFCNYLEVYGNQKKCCYKENGLCALETFYPDFHPIDYEDIIAAIKEKSL